jgi:hypothetical protein
LQDLRTSNDEINWFCRAALVAVTVLVMLMYAVPLVPSLWSNTTTLTERNPSLVTDKSADS